MYLGEQQEKMRGLKYIERNQPESNFSKKAIYVILECSECFFLLPSNKYVLSMVSLMATVHLIYNTVQYIHNIIIIII